MGSSRSGFATVSVENPRAVYEEAIHQRTQQYRDLKEAVAGILLHAQQARGRDHRATG